MYEEKEMTAKFSRLQAFLGAWTLGGFSILMFLGSSPILGVVFAFVGLAILLIAITGKPERRRPYIRLELIALWIGFPILIATFAVLLAVGFLPAASAAWVALYLLVVTFLFILLIVESTKAQKQT